MGLIYTCGTAGSYWIFRGVGGGLYKMNIAG